MHHPSRGGVRGGQDQFDWDDVKSDKHRENYLGHSLMAPVGRWQKGKDLQWFSKNADEKKKKCREEIDAVKRMEAEAMAAALGRGPVRRVSSSLTKQEMAETLKRGQTERDDMNIERVEGMGYGSQRSSLMGLGSGFVAATSSEKTQDHVDSSKVMSSNKDSEVTRHEKQKKKHRKKEKKLKKKKRRHDSSSDSDKEKTRTRKHDEERKEKNRKRHDSSSNTEDEVERKLFKGHEHDSTSEKHQKKRKHKTKEKHRH